MIPKVQPSIARIFLGLAKRGDCHCPLGLPHDPRAHPRLATTERPG